MAAIEITPLAPPPGAVSSPMNSAPAGGGVAAPMPVPQSLEQMPGFGTAMQIQPLTPLYNPNAAVEALQNVVNTQKGSISASAEALQKNTIIQQNLLDTQTSLQDDSLDAYDNLTRIARWGDVSDILSLFNSKWSEEVQTLRIKKNDVVAQTQSLRAQAKINLNNQLPALEGAKAQLAAQDFDNQLKLIDLQSKFGALDNQRLEQINKRLEIQLSMSQEQRARVDLAAKALDTKGAMAQLKLAAQGKGEWVGMEGILEDKIRADELAEANLQSLDLSIREKNITLQEKAEQRVAQSIPVADAKALWAQAQATGSPTVQWRGRNIPASVVAEAAKKNEEVEQALTLSIMNNRVERVGTEFTNAANMATSLATVDPRAARHAGLLQSAYNQLDVNNPASVANFGVVVNATKKELGEIAKSVASTYPSADAKAAVVQFGETGKPSVQGSQAVVRDTIGNYAAGSTSKFSSAYGVLNTELARLLAQQNITGAPFVDARGPRESQTQAMLAWAFRTNPKKLDDLKAEIMADPVVHQKVTERISGTLAADMANRAVTTLSNAENGDPVWKQLVNNPQLIQTGGAFDRRKLIDYLEKKTATQGPNSIDYNKIYADALRAQVMEAARQGNNDPAYTIHDRFLETFYYGDNPAQAALGDFIVNFESDRMRAKEEMQKRIQSDATGKTQRDAAVSEMSLFGLAKVGINPDTAAQTIKTTPSATGAPVTADQMRVLYGGGAR